MQKQNEKKKERIKSSRTQIQMDIVHNDRIQCVIWMVCRKSCIVAKLYVHEIDLEMMTIQFYSTVQKPEYIRQTD